MSVVFVFAKMTKHFAEIVDARLTKESRSQTKRGSTCGTVEAKRGVFDLWRDDKTGATH